MRPMLLGRERKVDPRASTAKIQALRQSRAAVVAEGEKKAGQAFLAKAVAEPGAKKTDSGLVITTLKPGPGPDPKPNEKVKVHYHGTLPDGSVFDSSVRRENPLTAGCRALYVGEPAA